MKRIQYLIIATIFLSLLSACANDTYPPIFYTLANEYDTSDERGLADNAGILEIVKAGGNYFALVSKLIYRTETGNWDPDLDNRKDEYNLASTPATLGDDAVCLNLEVEGGNLFAAFFEFGDPDKGGLYYTADASDPGNIAWTLVSDTDIDDTQIDWIKSIGTGELFVSTKDATGDYMLYYSTTPTVDDSFDPVVFQAGDEPVPSVPFIDVAWNGTEYWVIVGPYLYSGPLNNLVLESDTDDPQATGGRTFKALLGLASGDVCLTGIARDQDGTTTDSPSNLWIWDDSGSNWLRKRELEDPTDPESDLLSLTTFVDLTATTPDILIGTEGFGYLELNKADIATGTITIGRPAPAEIGDLDEAAINSFYPTSTPDPLIVFACTAGSGLWRADWNNPTELWKRE